MTRSSSISLVLAALSLACASNPAATPPRSAPIEIQAALPPPVITATPAMNPVGTFDYTAIVPDGSASNGDLIITGSPGAYTGTISREGSGGVDLTSVVVEGQTMTVSANIPEGLVVLTLHFTGNDFAGKWTLQGTEGAISGKRR